MNNEENPLVEHARRELRILGYHPNSEDKMDYDIYLSTINIVKTFTSVGHSGGSAPFHIDMIEKLLRFEPLGPITDNPSEWFDHGMGGLGEPDKQAWQSKRHPACFSEDGGKTYYSVDEFRRGWRAKLFGRKVLHTSERSGFHLIDGIGGEQ